MTTVFLLILIALILAVWVETRNEAKTKKSRFR